MKSFMVRREINALPAKIWEILCDPSQLATSAFGIISLKGTISSGSKIKLVSEVDPKRAFSLKVADYEQFKRMTWTGGMPFGLFTGRREFSLEAAQLDRGTVFTMEEHFSGALSGLIAKSMPDLTPSFEKFGDALKERAEA